MPDVSIMVAARDNLSESMRRMANNTTPLRNDLHALQGELDHLNNRRYDLNVDMSRARQALNETRRAFERTGSAADELAYRTAQSNYDGIRTNLNLVSRGARQTERDMLSLSRTTSRIENRAGGASLGGGSGALGGIGMLSAIGKAGMYKMLGDAASQIAGVGINSAFGSNVGTMFSSALGSAASGAAIGSMIAPGAGTAIGALAGGAVGIAQGATQIYQQKDDAFKGYVKEQYDNVTGEQKTMLTSGSSIASNREMTQISFATLFKDDKVASKYLDEVKTMANTTPFLYDDLTAMSKVLSTYGYGVKELIPSMTKIGDAGAALGLDTANMSAVATYLGRMKSSGKASAEYINPLTERGIDAYGYLAKSKGISKSQAMKLVSDGDISGQKAAQIILDAMGKAFSGSMERQSKTFSGLESTLQGMNDEMANAMGEGYNQGRKTGMEKQIDWLGGESGKTMEEANRAIGAWKADLENNKEEFIRKYVDETMKSDEYQTAKATGNSAEMGKLLMEAKIKGMNEYNASDGAQLALESEKSLADSIREDASSNDAFWNAGYQKGQWFDKGLASSIAEFGSKYQVAGIEGGVTEDELNTIIGTVTTTPKGTPPAKAFGMSFVPYDNFPAMLHYGERVLTASEAREHENGGQPVTVTGNSFVIREEADIYKIASELNRQISIARAAKKPVS